MQSDAMPIASTPPAGSRPISAGSRQVVDTTARATAHRPMPA